MTLARMLGISFLVYLLAIAACSGGGGNNYTMPKMPGEDGIMIDGYLFDADGHPIPGMLVTIADSSGKVIDETSTNEFGNFGLEVDSEGTYLINARSQASGGRSYSWMYSLPSGGEALDPGNPSDGGVVSPDGQVIISIPSGGEITPLNPPDEFEVELGAGGPTRFTLKGANSMLKIRQSTNLDELDGIIRLEGARGEHEAFQIVPVLLPGINQISDVQVETSDLVQGSNRISKSNITIYKEHYVNVTEPSDNGGATGLWPDALVPLTDPFDVAASMPSPIWVDVNIPRNAAPGLYNGLLRFSTPGDGANTFSFTLDVWNITFPMKFAMKANFGLDQEDIAGAHGLPNGLGTVEGRAMARKYVEFLAQRHISFHGTPVLNPRTTVNPDKRSVSLDFAEMDYEIDAFLRDYDLPVFNFPLDYFDCIPSGVIGNGESMFTNDFNARFKDYVQKVSSHLAARGVLDRAYIQLVDEPNTESEYQLVRDWDYLIKQASIYPKHMVTEQPAPENALWGTLTDSVDIFTSGLRSFWSMKGEANARAGGESKEEWLYTNANVYPFPSFAIDKQGVETRLFLWFAYQHGFDGIFYFSANNWTGANPWVDPLTFGSGFGNGCGSLLYPGTVAETYTGQNNFNGPVTSIRLELIRDGLEDAQLLWMVGGGNPVPQADSLMTGWFDWSRNPEELLSVRSQLGDAFGS